MKKRILAVSLAVLVVLSISIFGLMGCDNVKTGKLSSNKLEVTLAEDGTGYTAKQQFTYQNNSGTKLSELYFYFYPGCFSDEDKLPISENDYNSAYPNGMSLASYDLGKTSVGGTDCTAQLYEDKNHIYRFALEKPLKANKSVTLDFQYEVSLPYTTLRFGYNDDSINLAQFYFQPAVFDGEEWYLYDYYSNGDPFYAEMSDVEMTLSYPEKYKSVYSGSLKEEKTENSIITLSITAPRIRDFAIVLSETGNIIETEADGIKIRYLYTRDTDFEVSLAQAALSIKTFNTLFGKYEYDTFSMADVDFLHGGMEFTNLIYVTSKAKGVDRERIIAHETAHQWWYSSVGSNQVADAWQDEALTEFSTVLYFIENGKQAEADALVDYCLQSYTAFARLLQSYNVPVNSSIARSLSEFTADSEYTVMVYCTGTLMYNNLYTFMGREAFLKAVRDYYSEYKYKNAEPSELFQCFEKQCKNISDIIAKWLDGKVVISGIVGNQQEGNGEITKDMEETLQETLSPLGNY